MIEVIEVIEPSKNLLKTKIFKIFMISMLITNRKVNMKTENYLSKIVDFLASWPPKNHLKNENSQHFCDFNTDNKQ